MSAAMKRVLGSILLGLVAAVAVAQVDEVVDIIYEINNPPTVAPMSIYENGVLVGTESILDLTTTGGLCTVTPGIKIVCAFSAGGGYNLVQNEGTGLTARTTLNCVGAGITCADVGGKTEIQVGAAAGAVTLQGAYPGTPDTGNANITGTLGSTRAALHATLGNFGLSLENNTAAQVGQTMEYSPGIRLLGAAWDTDGAVSNTNAWQILAKPVNGNTTSIDLSFNASLNGGAYAQRAYLSSDGKLSLGETGATVGALRLFNATSGSVTISPVAGALGTIDLTVAGPNGQVLTTGADVTMAQIVPASAASVLLGRGSAAGAGDFQEVTLGSGLTMTNQVLSVGGTASYPGLTFDPSTTMVVWEDFLARSLASSAPNNELTGGSVWASGTGTGTVTQNVSLNSDGNHPGVQQMTTGTTTTGVHSFMVGNGTGGSNATDTIAITGGEIIEWRVYIPNASDGTNTFKTWIGFCDIITSNGDCTDGLVVYWDNNADTHWGCGADGGGVRTNNLSTTVATAAAWHKVRITVNSNATSVKYEVDGAELSCSPIANGNIPSGVGEGTLGQFRIGATAGCATATLCIADVDSVYLYKPGLTR